MKVHKRANQFVRGLLVWWEDVYPLDERSKPENSGVGHKNFALRPVAAQIYDTAKNWAAERRPLMWEITITAVFRKASYLMLEHRILRGHGTISDLSQAFPDQIRDATAEGEEHGGEYVTTRFKFECLGDSPLRRNQKTINRGSSNA